MNDDSVPHKQCRDCKQWKLATPEFFNKTALYVSPDGLNKQCSDCRNKYRKALKKKPKLPKPQDGYKRCATCKHDFPATTKFFYADRTGKYSLGYRCKPCHDEYRHALFANKKVVATKKCSKCKEPKPADIKHFSTDANTFDGWTRQCKECRNARNRTSRSSQRRRTRKHENGGMYTPQQIEEQLKRQKGFCYYCKHKLIKYHIDHVMPLSRGGLNDISNVVLACPYCNLSKGNKLLSEWFVGGYLL